MHPPAIQTIDNKQIEFWFDVEIKIGKELNYLNTIILMIYLQILIAFIQLDNMSLPFLICIFIPSTPSNSNSKLPLTVQLTLITI